LQIFLCKAGLIGPQHGGKEAWTCNAAASNTSPIQPVGKIVSANRLRLLRVIRVEMFVIKNYGCGGWSFHSTIKKVFLKTRNVDSWCMSTTRLSYLQAVTLSQSR